MPQTIAAIARSQELTIVHVTQSKAAAHFISGQRNVRETTLLRKRFEFSRRRENWRALDRPAISAARYFDRRFSTLLRGDVVSLRPATQPWGRHVGRHCRGGIKF